MVDWLEQPFSLKPKLLHQRMCCCTPSCTQLVCCRLLVSNRTLLQHFSVTQPPQSAQFQLCSRVFIVLADFYRAVHWSVLGFPSAITMEEFQKLWWKRSDEQSIMIWRPSKESFCKNWSKLWEVAVQRMQGLQELPNTSPANISQIFHCPQTAANIWLPWECCKYLDRQISGKCDGCTKWWLMVPWGQKKSEVGWESVIS